MAGLEEVAQSESSARWKMTLEGRLSPLLVAWGFLEESNIESKINMKGGSIGYPAYSPATQHVASNPDHTLLQPIDRAEVPSHKLSSPAHLLKTSPLAQPPNPPDSPQCLAVCGPRYEGCFNSGGEAFESNRTLL